MADDLGTAVLRITVNDEAARESLRLLRQDIQRSTRVGGAGGRAQGGARESIRALEQAQERRFRLAQRIERLEDRGVNVSRLRARLGDATTAQANREFEKQRRISFELNRQVRLAEARLQRERQLNIVLTRRARIGGARESIRGRVGLTGSPADFAFLARQGGARSPIGGRVGLTGSPADLAFLARQGGARSPISGAVNIPGSPAFLAAQRRFEAGELSRAARLGGPRSPIGGAIGIPGSPAAIRAEEQLAAARQRAAQAAEKASQAEGRRIGRLNVSPIRGGAAFPGSPDFISARQRELGELFVQREQRFRSLDLSTFRAQDRRSRLRQPPAGRGRGFDVSGAVSSAVIGGAFPLLFGQGTGAAAGGLFGGLLGAAGGPGGGFAGSLVGTAIGQVADQFRELSAALDDPIKALDLLKERAALSGRGVELLAEQLVAAGRSAEASALIQSDLGRVLDPSVVRAVAAANEAYSRNIGELQLKLGAFLSGPATGFSSWLTEIINRVTGLPTGLPTERGALATRGQGAALGIGGTLLAGLGLGLSATGVGASVGIPIALAGAGLAGTGALQTGGAESQQQQIAAARATEQNQRRIVELEQRRIGYQRQINTASRTGQFNTQRELQLKEQLAAVDQEQERAAATFVSTPGATTERELSAFRDQINALKLRREELQKNSDSQTKLIQADARIAQLQAGGFERGALVEQLRRVSIAGGDPVTSLAQQKSLQAQIVALDRDRAATAQLRLTSFKQETAELDRQFNVAKSIAAIGTAEGVTIARDAAQFAATLNQQVSQARQAEADIAAQIIAEQQRGGEQAAIRITELTQQQVVAAQNTRNLLFEGATQLRDAGQQLALNLSDAVTNFTAIRSDPQGLNRFLSPRAQANRAEGDFRLLLPQFRNAQGQFTRLTGERAPEFAGPTAGVNAAIRDFINAVNAEGAAQQVLIQTNQALQTTNDALATWTAKLVGQVARLADKDWNVEVFVNGAPQKLPLPAGGLP